MIFGVIGAGWMGRNHVRVLSELKRVDEVLIYDKNCEVAQEVADEFDASVAGSPEDLINAADAVSICAPTSLHYLYAKMSIEAEKHTFVEKPLASNYREGRKLVEILKNRDIVFGVGHIERFNPIVSEIERLDMNVTYGDFKRHNPASSRISDSTVVEDLMIHDIDIVFNVLFSESEYRLSAAGNKNVMQVLVNFGSAVVSISASRISSKKIRKIYLENSNITVEGDFMNQELFIFRKPSVYQKVNERYVQENVIEKVLINKVEPLKVELKKFIECIEKDESFPVSAEQAVKNLEICELIWKSIC